MRIVRALKYVALNSSQPSPISAGLVGHPAARSISLICSAGINWSASRPRKSGQRSRSNSSLCASSSALMYLARVCSTAPSSSSGVRVRRPNGTLHFVAAGPGVADRVDVQVAQVALQYPLVEGGDGDRAHPDLEPVRERGTFVTLAVSQPLHLPEVAELVLGARGRPGRLVGLHAEARHDQALDKVLVACWSPARRSAGLPYPLAQMVLHQRPAGRVDRLDLQRVGDQPVGP